MKGGTKGKTTAVYVENPLTMYNPLFSVQQIVTEKMNAIFLLVNDRNTNWTLYTVRRSTKHITILTGSLQSYSINYGLEAPYFGYAFFKPIFKKLAHYLSLKLSHNTWRPWKKRRILELAWRALSGQFVSVQIPIFPLKEIRHYGSLF